MEFVVLGLAALIVGAMFKFGSESDWIIIMFLCVALALFLFSSGLDEPINNAIPQATPAYQLFNNNTDFQGIR